MQGRPPRATTRFALEAFARERRRRLRAVDLGCGGGRDARAILEAGHRLLAIDRTPEAETALERALPPRLRCRLRFIRADLADFTPPACDFINASFCLFALPREAFLGLWERIRSALAPGGRFAGHLLGPEDSWVVRGRCWGVDRQELAQLAAGFTLEYLDEERCRSRTPRGEIKHWHLWHLVLRRD